MLKLITYSDTLHDKIKNSQLDTIDLIQKKFKEFVSINDDIIIFNEASDKWLCYAKNSINVIIKGLVPYIKSSDFVNFKLKRINIDTSIIYFGENIQFNIVLYNLTVESDFNIIQPHIKSGMVYFHHIVNILSNPIYNDDFTYKINQNTLNEFISLFKKHNSDEIDIIKLNKYNIFPIYFIRDNLLYLYSINGITAYILYNDDNKKMQDLLNYIKRNKTMYYKFVKSNINFMGATYQIYINNNLKYIIYNNTNCMFRNKTNRSNATQMYKLKYIILDLIFFQNVKKIPKIQINNMFDIELANISSSCMSKYELYYKYIWLKKPPQLYHYVH